MKKKFVFLLPVFCLVLLTFGLYGLFKKSTPMGTKPVVLTTIAPYESFLKELVGDDLSVITLIPSNFDPHMFEPSPRDLFSMAETALWVRCGEPIEEKFDAVLPKKTKRMFLSSYQHAKHDHHAHDGHRHEHVDPHYWTSPKKLQNDIYEIAEELALCFPEKREVILARADAIEKRLKSLDTAIHTLLDTKRDLAILVSHPSFGPFCEDYGIEQISLEAEGKELSARDILERKNHLQQHQDRLFIVAQPQHPFGDLSHFELAESPRLEVDPYSTNIEAALLHFAEQISDDSNK